MKITTPGQIGKAAKDLSLEAFRQSLGTVGEEECLYIGRHIERKLASLESCSLAWVHDLWLCAEALDHLYADHINGIAELPEEARRVVIAALHYLVNPFDVVPDHVPSRGYEDDAAVLNEAMKMLDRALPGMVDRYVERVRGLQRGAE